MPPRIRLVAISTERLSQRSTYTPARTPNTTDGMISVSTATLSCVLELLRCWTRTTMPYQIAFCAVWLMACASHSNRKSRLRQIERSSGPTRCGSGSSRRPLIEAAGAGASVGALPGGMRYAGSAEGSGGMARLRKVLSLRSNWLRGKRTRCSQVAQRKPISAPSRTTDQSLPPQGCGFLKRTTSPTCTSTKRAVLIVAVGSARGDERLHAGTVDRQLQALRLSTGRCLPVGACAGVGDRAAGIDDHTLTIRVNARSDGGREIALLRAHAGEQDGHRGSDAAHRRDVARIGSADDEADGAVAIPLQRAASDVNEQRL